jgi:hypothetical protein
MALQFEHSDAVEYAGVVFKEKHVVPLRPSEGAELQKIQVVPLRPIDGAGVPKKAWFDLYLPQV